MDISFFQEGFGSTSPVGGSEVTIFIPSKNKLGEDIDQQHWRTCALETLGRLFRGATAFPPGKGVWRNDERGGELIFEETIMITSYVPEHELKKRVQDLRRFLHRFGRETNQGEIGLVINGTYYPITTFDN
jgi:hypothetical protein